MNPRAPFRAARALFAGLCLLLPLPGLAVGDPAAGFFDQSFGDFQEELANAREQGKQGVMLFFELTDCPFCARMKKTVLNKPEVQAWYKQNFLSFTVDIEGDNEVVNFQGEATTEKDFAFQSNRVRATPVMAFFNLDGKRVARHTGPSRNAGEFLLLGEYVVGKHYLKERFTRFKRKRLADARQR